MEPTSKVTAEFSIEPNDIYTTKLLLCYILMKLNSEITSKQLYEIAVSSELVNYFLYTEALNQLIENQTINMSQNNEDTVYTLADKGKFGIDEFKQYIPKSIRDKTITYALRYFAKLRHEDEVLCSFISTENGIYVQLKILDIKNELLDIKLYAPDMEQAQYIKQNVMKNPANFYKNVIDLVLDNKEEQYNLD